MKRVRITISAYTRVEYTTEVEVPDDATDDDVIEIADKLYENTDGGEFTDDNDYWERGGTNWRFLSNPLKEWTPEDQKNALSQGWGIFTLDSDKFEIQRYDESGIFADDVKALQHVLSSDDQTCIKAANIFHSI